MSRDHTIEVWLDQYGNDICVDVEYDSPDDYDVYLEIGTVRNPLPKIDKFSKSTIRDAINADLADLEQDGDLEIGMDA